MLISLTVSFTLRAQETREDLTKSFNHVYLQYTADTEHFDHGYYGIGLNSFSANGLGATISFHGSWGISDPGQFMTKFGPIYGYPINRYLMVNGSLRGFIYTYDKLNGKTQTSTDQKVNGGITLTPGVTFKLGKFLIDAGFEFGWANKSDELYKSVEIGLGYAF